MLKTYQFKTHCKGDSHSSKPANIILPELMTEYRWMPLHVQNRNGSVWDKVITFIVSKAICCLSSFALAFWMFSHSVEFYVLLSVLWVLASDGWWEAWQPSPKVTRSY